MDQITTTLDQVQVAQKYKDWLKEAKDHRIKVEATWMEIDSMMDGNHYVYYDKFNRTIQQVPVVRKGSIRRTVNKMRVQEKALCNMINKNEPAFNVTPKLNPESKPDEIQKSKSDAQVIQYKLASYYREEHLKHKFKDAVRISARYGVAIGQVCWDEKEDEPEIHIDSPWDRYIDPTCGGEICKARFVIKATPVDLESIKNNKKYKNTEFIKSEAEKQAESEFRNQFLQFKYPSIGNKNRAIMFECWEIIEEKGDSEDESKEKCKVTSWIGDILVREEYYNDDELPFELYYVNKVKGELYPRPVFADVIGLNKSLDAIFSFMEEHVASVGVGRYLKHDKVELNTVSTGQHGQILSYTGNVEGRPIPLEIPPLPQSVYSLKDAIERAMDEITGVQTFNMEAIARSGASGALIAQLQAQQASQLGEPTENLELFATRLCEIILDMMENNYATPRIVQSPKGESTAAYSIRGKKAMSDIVDKKDGETILDSDKFSVNISIIPGSAFSDIQKKQDIVELYDRKAIDRTTLLEAYSLGNTTEILQNIMKEEREKMALAEEQKVRMSNVDNKLAYEKQLQAQLQQMGNIQGQQDMSQIMQGGAATQDIQQPQM